MKNENEYIRKRKESQPVLAICYDFDKTLTPTDMQAQGYIQTIGYDVSEFWKESNGLSVSNDMDRNLAYMLKMKEEAEGKLVFTKKQLEEYGAKVELFPGVDTWFERMREYGRQQGVIVEHYIISSGLKEMIDGTSVAKNGAFERIYASSFYYNEKGVAVWPAQVVNYTNKTQFLFRIEKGVLDVNDSGVNDYFPPEEIRVPFRNMVYIGDSDTDIPCMKLVNANGGHSIGVFNAQTRDKTSVYKMIRDSRIKYYAPADYQEDSELDHLLKAIIDKTAKSEVLEQIAIDCRMEVAEQDKKNDEKEIEKRELIIALDNSSSFISTHMIVKKLRSYSEWTEEECEILYSIALKNSQVRYILKDIDIKMLYSSLLGISNSSEKAQEVKQILEGD